MAGLLERLGGAIAELKARDESGLDATAANLPGELADEQFLRRQVRRAMEEPSDRGRRERINSTDRDAVPMRNSRGILPCHNARARHASRRGTRLIEPALGIAEEQQGARLLRGPANVAAWWVELAAALNPRTPRRIWRPRTPALPPRRPAPQPEF